MSGSADLGLAEKAAVQAVCLLKAATPVMRDRCFEESGRMGHDTAAEQKAPRLPL
jgi:hypothetical protein